MTTYAIRARFYVLNDKRLSPNYRFHINTGDYFAALATFLGAISDALRDNIQNGELPQPRYIQVLDDMRDDLRSAQEEYRIEPK